MLSALFLGLLTGGQLPAPSVHDLDPPLVFYGDQYFRSAESPGSSPSFASFEIRYRLTQEVRLGGGVRLFLGYPWKGANHSRLRRGSWRDFQFDQPAQADFASVEVSGHQDYEIVDGDPVVQRNTQFGFELRPTRADHPFPAGQEFVFYLGDRRGGSPGYRMPKTSGQIWILIEERPDAAAPNRLRLPVADYPRIEVGPGSCDRLEILIDSNGAPGDAFKVTLQARQNLDGFDRNSAIARTFTGRFRLTSSRSIPDLPTEVEFTRADHGVLHLTVHPDQRGVDRIVAESVVDGVLRGTSNPFLVQFPVAGSRYRRLLWGNLHVHSAIGGHGLGTPQQAFAYARDDAHLDFMGLTEHSSGSNDNAFDWQELRILSDRESVPGAFVAFVGYEWTSRSAGHRNVIFRDAARTLDIYRETNWASGQDLLDWMSGRQVIGIPHHPAWRSSGPMDWGKELMHPNQPLVEIYSWHGSSEYPNNPLPIHRDPDENHPAGLGVYVQEALRAGRRLGFTGDSDTHAVTPGSNIGLVKRYSRLGITGVYAAELSRDGIWEGLTERRTVATTGARILGAVMLDRSGLGAEVYSDQPPRLRLEVYGTSPIVSLTLFRNGDQPVLHRTPGTLDFRTTWIDRDTLPGQEYSYYLKVLQEDGHRAWFSPIWFRRL